MFGYRARVGYISPSVMELNAYDFYRIVPDGVGLIAVTSMVEGWKEDAYKRACPPLLRLRHSRRRAVGFEPR